MVTAADLRRSPNPLAEHYRHFRVADRLLLTGHSHQAWPDCGQAGQQQAWLDAAEHVDDKWERAFQKADVVRQGYRRLLDDPDGLYSLAASTHDLLVRFLSALPLAERPRLVTTDSEFYSLRRQLARLEEEGIQIVRVPAYPSADVGARLAQAIDDGTAAVLFSTVFFDTAQIAGGVETAAAACRKHGAHLLLDAYHQLNVVPCSLRHSGFEDAYVVGAGYKYCQLGEGNAFLRFPGNCELRPVATGWFAEFDELSVLKNSGPVAYNQSHDRFAGATYDPTSNYRAAAVFDFFVEQQLTPELLRRNSQHQMNLLCEQFDALALDPSRCDRDHTTPLERLGGFLALRAPSAGAICNGLKKRGMATDFRGNTLRLGPAPYLSDEQLVQAIQHLGEVVQEVQVPA